MQLPFETKQNELRNIIIDRYHYVPDQLTIVQPQIVKLTQIGSLYHNNWFSSIVLDPQNLISKHSKRQWYNFDLFSVNSDFVHDT